jgi:ATP-binding cassette subfamily F protein 3
MFDRALEYYQRSLRIKEERYAADLRAWENQQDFIRKEDAFVRQHMGSHRVTEAKGRQKKLEALVRVSKPFHDVRKPVIKPPAAERGGETVLEARDLAGGYPGKVTFRDATFRIARAERIGIVGRNGAGKTTLMKILAGRMAPLEGEVALGHKAAVGFYDQDTSALREDGTPYYEMRRSYPQLEDQEIRDHLARFLFRGVELDSPIAGLSGGERARVALCRALALDPRILVLDEPTASFDPVLRAEFALLLRDLVERRGLALLFVAHDRALVEMLADEVLELVGGRLRPAGQDSGSP